MLKLGYNQNLAIGTICASGSLGTMIPPSIVLIIFGLITETSIKALFKNDERICEYVVESENFESIHNHSAYAQIHQIKDE